MGKKNEILEKSLSMFNSSNIKSVTTNHICEELRISPGNLYYHFKNKEEIIKSLFKNFWDKHICLKENYLNIAEIKRMSQFYDDFFKLVWEYRFILRESYYLRNIDSELDDLFTQYKENLISSIYIQSSKYRTRGLLKQVNKETLHKKAEIVSILLINIINHDSNIEFNEWTSNCQRYKEMIIHIFSS